MPRPNRRDIVLPDEVGVYHCYSRCARGAFLCGFDRATQTDFGYRKQWIVERQNLLAAIFGLELLAYAVLDNHMHHVIRTRPDLVELWSDEEVIRRWHQLHPQKSERGGVIELTPDRIDALRKNKDLISVWRRRLGSLSWYMKELKENIAKRANRETGATGAFFDARFNSPRLADALTLLICLLYVDLNPVRAKLVSRPEAYPFCSFNQRFRSLRLRIRDGEAGTDLNRPGRPDAALQPIPEQGETGNETAPSERPSNKGILAMDTAHYLSLVDWSGRQLRPDKRGKIPDHLPPLLNRLGDCSEQFLSNLTDIYDTCLHRAGARVSVSAHARIG